MASTSLVLGQAFRALNSGVNLTLVPDTPAMFQRAGMMSPEGRCKTLDAAADGYVRAESVVTALLQAGGGEDGAVCAVVRGTAVNQGGRSSTLTAPNGPSQQDVIRNALREAGAHPADVAGLHMHGTGKASLIVINFLSHALESPGFSLTSRRSGTPLGDPIEVGAAAAVLVEGQGQRRAVPLSLMASKTWLGHAESGAGMVGVAHAALSVAHAAALGITHLRELNPYVTSTLRTSEAGAWCMPRQTFGLPSIDRGAHSLCGLSSFAFQGTNAHAVMQASIYLPNTQRPAAASWAREYHWLAPAPHPMLQLATLQPPGVALECWLSGTQGLAYMWDHRVGDRVLFPGAGFFEFAAAGVRLLGGRLASGALLGGITIPAPLRLPETMGPDHVALRCSVDLATGRVILASSPSAFKQPHLVGTAGMVRLAATPEVPHPAVPGRALLLSLPSCQPFTPDAPLLSVVHNARCDEGQQFEAAALDSCMQLAAAAVAPGSMSMKVPAALEGLHAPEAAPDTRLWASCSGASRAAGPAEPSVMDFGLGGASLHGLVAKPLGGAAAADGEGEVAAEKMLYESQWPASSPWTSSILDLAGGGAHPTASIGVAASPAATAAAALAALQSAGLESLGGCQMSTVGASVSDQQIIGCHLSASTAAQGLLRSVATEMRAQHFGVVDLDVGDSVEGTGLALLGAGEAPSSSVLGEAVRSGVLRTAQLLPSAACPTLPVAPRPLQPPLV